ncbi:transglutaminase N-terminal domain-containing protein [Roseibium salinum]|nr:transglutaminase N-terminal domain-containing protein [Roseibium salinum]
MRLSVRHTTRYRYDTPLTNAMQQLRLTPEDGPTQKIVEWSIQAPGIERATTYKDAFGNQVHMVSGGAVRFTTWKSPHPEWSIQSTPTVFWGMSRMPGYRRASSPGSRR